MPKKKNNEEVIEEDYQEDEEEVKPEPMENVEEDNQSERFLQDIENRFNKIEKGITIIQKWISKHDVDIKRIEDNFKILMEKK